jgi:aerobic carbon-monoxide dehydrogenase medium subunit
LKPSRFELVRPRTIAEAVTALSTLEDACVVAGGQSLVPMMNLRVAAPSALVDINLIEEMKGIRVEEGRLVIGAATRQQDILESDLVAQHAPLLAAALKYVGHYATRCRGTLGGSLANADHSAESSLVCATLRAEMKIAGPSASKMVPAEEFIVDVMATILQPGELLTEISIPVAPSGTKMAFKEFARHHGHFATAAAAVQWSEREGQLRVGLGAIAATPFICKIIEQQSNGLRGRPDGIESLIAEQLSTIDIISDVHTSDEYRRQLATVCLTDCLRQVGLHEFAK